MMPEVCDLPIRRCRPSEDVVPFSECRNNLSSYINRVRETHRPILITQNGRAASYLVDAESMDALFDRMELSRDIEISRREFAEGKGIPHEQVMREMDEMIQGWMRDEECHDAQVVAAR
ncbi:MAG: type II toxin-antitoxin system Phd/YefM family antitoxin [Kiritimatiellae bacterium]|nr:type II toxin-antitoxin system Phd/YefM family antitoxin [Kiritimatiellia bacterium]